MSKPVYSVPSMTDVAKVRGSNGYSLVSTFSGCGGACLGYEMAGFKPLWANEFIDEARATYAANHPGVILDGRDIREVSGREILEATGLSEGELDLFEGSPPCSPFSTAGSISNGWGKVKKYSDKAQRSDDLFFEYSRLVGELRPKVFAAENVAGLVTGKAIGYFKLILSDLKAEGYRVSAKVLDASWLGVPQARKRLILIGVRDDLGLEPVFPKPLAYQYSVRDVLEGDVRLEREPVELVDRETGKDIGIAKYAIGPEWEKIRPGDNSASRFFQLVRPNPDRPVPTITATAGSVGAASVTHPLQPRKFNLDELRILSSFPSDFVLTGTYEQRAERIGRSVPPFLSRAIGETIRDEILANV
jgi:DNA (cytosine-5)-methyltransferase 1